MSEDVENQNYYRNRNSVKKLGDGVYYHHPPLEDLSQHININFHLIFYIHAYNHLIFYSNRNY